MALDARICSFECTFCAACVGRLGNVWPVDLAAHERFAAAIGPISPEKR